MIKSIIFDFGGIFLNIEEPVRNDRFEEMGFDNFKKDIEDFNITYERGEVTTPDFIQEYMRRLPDVGEEIIRKTWNSMLLDFPVTRLEFLKKLAAENKYNLVLLSNTNELHIDWVKNNIPFWDEFRNCFDGVYFSYEIGTRKPDADIYEYVLHQQNIKAEEALFIDDTVKNTEGAAKLGIHTWNLKPGKEDVTQLFEIKKELF